MNFLRPLAVLLALTLGGVSAAATDAAEPRDKTASRPAARETRDAVRAAVGAQLQALREGEFEQAYALAAEGIRRQFRLPVWVEMIRRGYAPLLRHERVEFGVIRPDGDDRASLPVVVFATDSRATRYRYDLVRERGGWRIAGVVAEREAPRGDI